MTLYQIEAEYRETVDLLIENGGALSPEIEARLQIAGELFEVKAEKYGLLIKEMNSDIEQLEAAIEDLRKRKKRIEQSLVGMKSRLLSAMTAMGKEKFKTPMVTMWIGQSKRLVVLHEHLIPEPYRYEVTEYKIDADALKKDLLAKRFETASAYVSEEKNLQIR